MVIRVRPEKKEEKERVRSALLKATLHLAVAHGFASLSLREVAREALIAPTSFYRHFEDMEELGLALIEEQVSPLVLDLTERTRAAATEGKNAPRAIGEALFASLESDPELFRFFVAERVGGSARFRAAIDAMVNGFIASIEDVLVPAFGSRARPPSVVRTTAQAMAAITLEVGFRALDASADERTALLARGVDQLRMVVLGADSMIAGSSETHHAGR